MIEHIITSCIFITAMIVIRSLFKDRIPHRLCYALWLIVAVKLLLPLPFLSNGLNVMNLINSNKTAKVMTDSKTYATDERYYRYKLANETANDISDQREIINEIPAQSREAKTEGKTADSLSSFINEKKAVIPFAIWILGSILFGMSLIISNLLFAKNIKLNRKKLDVEIFSSLYVETGKKVSPLYCPIYVTDSISTPCLFGLVAPAIYLTESFALGSSERLLQIITHEQVHYRHKDHIWAFIRCLILTAYWWNPLVWIAVKLSITDSELACDEGVVTVLGSGCKKAYGETLIEAGASNSNIPNALCTIGITNSKNELKLRIKALANSKKQSVSALVITCFLVLATAGCTFGTAKKIPEPERTDSGTANTVNNVTDLSTTYNCGAIYIDEGVITDGEENWKLFKEAADAGEGTPEQPLLIYIEESFDGETSYKQLTFDGEFYCHDGKKWKYLLDVSGLTGNPERLCREAALANDIYTFKELEWSVISSNSNDFIEHDFLFYAFDREYSDNSAKKTPATAEPAENETTEITWVDITKATLTYNNENTGISGTQTVNDAEKLNTLLKWFSEAEEEKGLPACPFNVAKLSFTYGNHKTASVMLASDSCPYFCINGVCYNYTPKELRDELSDDSRFSNDELKEMFDEIPWEY